MQISIVHSTNFDYKKDLYEPIIQFNRLNQHEIFFPHERGSMPECSKRMIESCDLIIAEVSYPSTGMGIELGWADKAQTPVICIHKKRLVPSSSLSLIFKNFISYENGNDLIFKLEKHIGKLEITS